MGVHIIVTKIISKSTEETWGGKQVPYYETEKQDWFDSLRYSGDNDFILMNKFTAVDLENPIEEQEFFRPTNFGKTRNWVEENIIDINQPRLLEALDKMEADENICFKWSW